MHICRRSVSDERAVKDRLGYEDIERVYVRTVKLDCHRRELDNVNNSSHLLSCRCLLADESYPLNDWAKAHSPSLRQEQIRLVYNPWD